MSSYILEGSDLGATFYADFAESGSITPTVGPAITYTRASTAYYTNSSGVLTQAAIDTPRLNYVRDGGLWRRAGLLLEGQATNQCLQSNDLTSGSWTLARGSVAANNIAWIDGNTVADKFTEDTANGVHGYVQFSLASTSGSPATFSVYLKAGTRSVFCVRFTQFSPATNYVAAEFDLSTGSVSVQPILGGNFTNGIANIENCGNGWYRCSVTATVQTTLCIVRVEVSRTTGQCTVGSPAGEIYTGDGSSNWYACGHQFEANSRPTSFIPTTTGVVVRSADLATVSGSNFSSIWGASENCVTAFFESPPSGTYGAVGFHDGTANEAISIYSTGTDPKLKIVDGGVTQADIDGGTVVTGVVSGVSCRVKLNDSAISAGGAAAVTDVSVTLPTVTTMVLGSDQAGNYLNGHLAKIKIIPSASDALLARLSTI